MVPTESVRSGNGRADARTTSRVGNRRPMAALVWALSALVLAAGCGAQPPYPTGSSAVTTDAPPGVPVTLDPAVISGVESSIEEGLKAGQYLYLSLPKVPGALAWTKVLRTELEPQVERFKELAPGTPKPPYPELSVTWGLVGASPKAIGVRLSTVELATDKTFSGKVQIAWWDPAIGAERPSQDLIAPDASQTFFDRVRAAAKTNADLDAATLADEFDGDWDGIDGVGFTTTGQLWVEFDRRQITQLEKSIAVTLSAEGLLSDFGELARAAALTPSDPALGGATPTAATTHSAKPATATPSTKPTTPSTKPTTQTPTAKPTKPSPSVNCAKLKCVALTFDDGPVAGTAQLLDVLKEKGVSATFFMVGSNAAMHPALIRRMVAEGHVIGNHTWDHPQLTRRSVESITSELNRTSDVIVKAGAPRPTLMRPPYGATNATVSQVAAELGLAQILWNVDPLDWKDRNSATVTKRVLAATRSGSIVLSHDIHPTTRAAYAAIIDGLRAKGFTLVTVPQLLGTTKPGHKYYHG